MTRGTAERVAAHDPQFARAKFRPTTLPTTLVTRPTLYDQLSAGAGKRLTVVVGSAGAGKSVLLSGWAATRLPRMTSWMSCDRADADPVRFWTGFIEAPRTLAPGFGAEAADLLAIDGAVSADVIASIANDAAQLPAGSAIAIDDFDAAAAVVSRDMADLVERWPADTAQLVLAARSDPPLRLHRLRLSGELCELRDRELYFSLAESRDLLANFGVQVGGSELAVLHRRSEGWTAALQMAALSLRDTGDAARVAHTLDVRSYPIAEYFIAEVLDQQPPEIVRFMLDTAILGDLTAGACAAVTARRDAATLLRRIDSGNLFLVALDDERTSFRYHQMVRQVLQAELRARDSDRERSLQLRAGEWFESAGDTWRAAHHFLAAEQIDRALALIQDGVVPDFLHEPVMLDTLDLDKIPPSLLADAPDRLLALASDLLISGDTARGSEYLDVLERAQPSIPPGSALAARLAAMRSLRHGLFGRLEAAVAEADNARAIQGRALVQDEWATVIPLILLRVYSCLDDGEAVEREAAAAMALPGLTEPAKLVLVPGARALASFQSGHLGEASQAAGYAEAAARRLGCDQHFFAVDHVRVLAGLALEQRDLDAAEQLTERALSITEGRPLFEFLTLLDRAEVWAARGQVRDALATAEAARLIVPGASPALLARAAELEALLHLSLGDRGRAEQLAEGVPPVRRDLLQARIALAAGDQHRAVERLQSPSMAVLTPRLSLVRQILLAAAAIGRRDPVADSLMASALQAAHQQGFLNTVVTTVPEVAGYLVEHASQVRPGLFSEQLIGAALDVRAARSAADRSSPVLVEPLTPAEVRILKLLPTSTYLQMAATLYVSRNTVKTHLRSIYQKLGVASRAQALERAVDLQLL